MSQGGASFAPTPLTKFKLLYSKHSVWKPGARFTWVQRSAAATAVALQPRAWRVLLQHKSADPRGSQPYRAARGSIWVRGVRRATQHFAKCIVHRASWPRGRRALPLPQFLPLLLSTTARLHGLGAAFRLLTPPRACCRRQSLQETARCSVNGESSAWQTLKMSSTSSTRCRDLVDNAKLFYKRYKHNFHREI